MSSSKHCARRSRSFLSDRGVLLMAMLLAIIQPWCLTKMFISLFIRLKKRRRELCEHGKVAVDTHLSAGRRELRGSKCSHVIWRESWRDGEGFLSWILSATLTAGLCIYLSPNIERTWLSASVCWCVCVQLSLWLDFNKTLFSVLLPLVPHPSSLLASVFLE